MAARISPWPGEHGPVSVPVELPDVVRVNGTRVRSRGLRDLARCKKTSWRVTIVTLYAGETSLPLRCVKWSATLALRLRLAKLLGQPAPSATPQAHRRPYRRPVHTKSHCVGIRVRPRQLSCTQTTDARTVRGAHPLLCRRFSPPSDRCTTAGRASLQRFAWLVY